MRKIKRYDEFAINENSSYVLPDIITYPEYNNAQADLADLMTDDGKGNYLFYHYSSKKFDSIKPGSGDEGLRTSREEMQALSSVGGLAMYYTRQRDKESLVGSVEHVVSIPKSKVYYFNGDALGFFDEAKIQFAKARPGLSFSPNYQVAWLTKVANERGFDMTIARWGGGKAMGGLKYGQAERDLKLRAQTTITLQPK